MTLLDSVTLVGISTFVISTELVELSIISIASQLMNDLNQAS